MKTRTIARLVAATGIAIVVPLLAAEALDAKTGLWENTVTMEMGGMSLPKEQLDKMPAAQRSQMEQMLKQMGVGAPRTITQKSCVTKEDLDQNAFTKSLQQDGNDCDYQQVASTSKRQEVTFQCKSADGNSTGRMVVEVVSDSHVRGTMEARMPQGRMDARFEAKWLSASCAGADKD